MAIFDSKKKHYLTFYVNLEDPVEIDTSVSPVPVGFPSGASTTIAALRTAFPNGMNTAPLLAAALMKAPFRGYSDPENAPATWAPWNSFGNEGGPYPINVSKFERRTGGFLGIGGTTVTYYWMGEFLEAPTDGAEDGDLEGLDGEPVEVNEQGEIEKRRWLCGFEEPGMGMEALGLNSGLAVSPDASRHVGGMGVAYRGASNTNVQVNHNFFDAGLNPPKAWERMYIRLRKLPAAGTPKFWAQNTNPSATVGCQLGIDTAGHLVLFQSNLTQVVAVKTSTKTLTEWNGLATQKAWYKLDILSEVNNNPTSGAPLLRVYLDGELIISHQQDSATFISTSRLGNPETLVNDLYLDIDDWMGTDIPYRAGVEALTGKDFLQGTKIVRIKPKQFGAAHVGGSWTGDVRTLMQRSALATTTREVTTSTALALMEVDTDSDLAIDADIGSIGVASMLIHTRSRRGTTSGRLGYTLAGAPAVMANITEGAVLGDQFARYTLDTTTASGSPVIPSITPITLRYEKGNDAAAAAVSSLSAQCELIGLWGPEDYPFDGQAGIKPPMVGIHNYRYPYSPWSRQALAGPIAPYIVKAGTYVGNGTGIDIALRAPVNFFFVRPLTGSLGGAFWLGTAIGDHLSFDLGLTQEIADAGEDASFVGGAGENVQQQQYLLRIAGNGTQVNAVGVTYQYIAVSDPGMRYMICGAMVHKSTFAGPYDNKLINPDYTPLFGMFLPENISGSTTNALYAKAAGQAAESLVGFGAAVVATALSFAQGKLTTKANFHNLAGSSGSALAYMLYRKEDGNKDTGEPAVVNFGSYTGDGSASRTINLAPTTGGKRPLFVMVFAEGGGTSFWRDPSHTGSNSSNQTGTEAATGITSGGPDQFSVGSSLNTNAVVFSYFVLYGGTTACNNGMACNDEYVPVEPTSPTDGPWPDDPPDPDAPVPDVPLSEEPDLDRTTVLSNSATMIWGQIGGKFCEEYSRGLANRALKHLGISKRIARADTDQTEEAFNVRDVLRETINEVLRDFPWPFATEYSDLVLVGGTATTPVNKDWQYSYRAPSRMLMVRRIVPTDDSRRAHDPNPIKFRLGNDTSGPLIFTNEAIPTGGTLVLEWTKRVTCPAFFGDPLFREAVAWKLASNLAMPLSRDSKKQAFALSMYRQVLYNAVVPAANEGQQEPDGDAPWIEGR